ncbi:MAG TPA: Asp-tRNA(Asn)/Glu-tRNA(Gln) amidotransferase GatCAB subunit B [Gammaproteobacteria bacterium]|jgi:aspartyl-tRNA(Asn)/glutamyl-tRNA(Gln) amidotransferase subunit B|nr:Asp-tRNA(Asn)/Glu-tRNA(Gln) amidotransferase GatCAB subunit B [Gammaproteobacteria bacterium]
MSWEPVIGLEVHAQLQTYSKIFSGAPTAYGAAPNTQACAVDIALPGVLPVMNRRAALLAVKFGLAVDARVNPRSIFARKNYFYPDLPKGYQISQYEIPIVAGGELFIDTAQGRKRIGITRAHLEEDAGKSLHEDFRGMTGVDLNRAGTPLLEIVSEPDMRTPAEAVAYLRKLHSLVRYLEICDGNMEEGSFRCDANISVRPMGQTQLGIRAELKNINSFRFVERALEFEITRQIEVLEDGGTVAQETRLYDPATDETRPMRSKEEAHDYRYFPDPDLPPLVITAADLEQARESLPELPDTRRQRFVTEYELSETDAAQLTAEKDTADYFEQALAANACDHRLMANWVTGELASWLNRTDTPISESKVSPNMLGELVRCIQDQTVSGKTAKAVFEAMWHGDGTAGEIIEARGLKQILDTEIIEQAVVEVIADFPGQVAQVRAGEEKVLSFLVGQVMKATSGKANPQAVNQILRQKLGS